MDNEDKQIAEGVVEQLGGFPNLIRMIGAHDFSYGSSFKGNGMSHLQFSFKADAINNATKIVVCLNYNSDDYEIFFMREIQDEELDTEIDIKELVERCLISHFKGVYCDKLKHVIEIETGLDLTMPRVVDAIGYLQ